MSRREYAVHDQTGRSRGFAPYRDLKTDPERLESCHEEAERLTEMTDDRRAAGWENCDDVFTVVTRLVTDWEPVTAASQDIVVTPPTFTSTTAESGSSQTPAKVEEPTE